MEIERQFLIDELPFLPTEYEYLSQGYVSLLPEIRIRQIGRRRFVLTVKRGAGLVREEWETDISLQEFESLSSRLYPGTVMIEKRRYHVLIENGATVEIHVHDGHLTGFNYVEVEFPTAEAAGGFEPPSWFGCEVTDDPRFSYGILAQADGMELMKKILEG